MFRDPMTPQVLMSGVLIVLLSGWEGHPAAPCCQSEQRYPITRKDARAKIKNCKLSEIQRVVAGSPTTTPQNTRVCKELNVIS